MNRRSFLAAVPAALAGLGGVKGTNGGAGFSLPAVTIVEPGWHLSDAPATSDVGLSGSGWVPTPGVATYFDDCAAMGWPWPPPSMVLTGEEASDVDKLSESLDKLIAQILLGGEG